jgi:hypothetical protein
MPNEVTWTEATTYHSLRGVDSHFLKRFVRPFYTRRRPENRFDLNTKSSGEAGIYEIVRLASGTQKLSFRHDAGGEGGFWSSSKNNLYPTRAFLTPNTCPKIFFIVHFSTYVFFLPKPVLPERRIRKTGGRADTMWQSVRRRSLGNTVST